MSRRKFLGLVIVACVTVAAVWLIGRDRRAIRSQLAAMASAAAAPAGENAADRTARAARLGGLVIDGVIIRRDAASFIGGHQAVVGWVLQGPAEYGALRVAFDDIDVASIGPDTASVFLTVKVSGDTPQAALLEPRQVHATLVKSKGEWQLAEAEVLRTLEPQK